MKKRTAKMKSMRKTGQEAPVLQKVNGQQSKSMVNNYDDVSKMM